MNVKELTGRLNEWANWRIRLEGSALGYPSSTTEARMGQGGKATPGPIVPNVVMNPRAAEIDRAVACMPTDLSLLIWLRHIEPGTESEKVRAWCEHYKCGRTNFYKTEKRAYGFLEGWLTRGA
jgi:hypothetical protein